MVLGRLEDHQPPVTALQVLALTFLPCAKLLPMQRSPSSVMLQFQRSTREDFAVSVVALLTFGTFKQWSCEDCCWVPGSSVVPSLLLAGI